MIVSGENVSCEYCTKLATARDGEACYRNEREGDGHSSCVSAEDKEKCEIKEVQCLRSTDKLRSSLLSRSIQWQKSIDFRNASEEDLENERQRWTEMESEWICLTDELRFDIETNRKRAEEVEMELRLEKKCSEELDDALQRSVVGHARMLEHYTELQEKYNDLIGKHSAMC